MAIFLTYMNESFETLTQSFEEVMEAMGSSQRFFDVLKREPTVNYDGGRRLPGAGRVSWPEERRPESAAESETKLKQRLQSKDEQQEQRASAKRKTKGHPIIEFEYVTFAYPADPGYVILSNLNLSLLPGTKYAIVGKNGAGKSTVFKLMNRLYDPDDG